MRSTAPLRSVVLKTNALIPRQWPLVSCVGEYYCEVLTLVTKGFLLGGRG
jgi:hypothetical protein